MYFVCLSGETLKVLLTKWLILLFVVVTVFAVSLRFSEQHGPMAARGCFLAIGLSLIAAVTGFIPFMLSSKNKASKFFISLLTGAGLRVAVTAIGVVVITVIISKEQRFWFLAWAGIYYLLFLSIETFEAVRCIKKLEFENDIDANNERHNARKYESS